MRTDFAFAIRFILAALAVYRLAMFTREEGAFAIFLRVQQWLGKRAAKRKYGGLAWTLASLATCPHCVGVWLALLIAPFVIWPTLTSDLALVFLGISGLQSYLTGKVDE